MQWPWQQQQSEAPRIMITRRQAEAFGHAIARHVKDAFEDEDTAWTEITERDKPRDLSERDLVNIRGNCRALWRKAPLAKQIEKLLLGGALGRQLPKPTSDDTAVQDVIDELWNDPDNQLALFSEEAQRKANVRLLCEGELFYLLFRSNADDQVKIGAVNPDQVKEIVTHPENDEKPVLYYRSWKPAEFDFDEGRYEPIGVIDRQKAYYIDHRWDLDGEYDAGTQELIDRADGVGAYDDSAAMLHIPINTLGMRGVPELQRSYDWMRAHHKTLSLLHTYTRAITMFAWRLKADTADTGRLTDLADLFDATDTDEAPGPGAASIMNRALAELEPIEQSGSALSAAGEMDRLLLLEAIRGYGFGEHYFGDSSTGNLATAQSMELPAIWQLESWQGIFRRLFESAIDYTLARRGVEGEYTCQFPAVKQPELSEVAQLSNALAAGVELMFIPRKTATEQVLRALNLPNVGQILDEFYEGE